MKKLLIIFLISFCFQLSAFSLSFAASPSPSAKPLPVSSATAEKAKELKDKVASKIAELKVIENRGFIGIIKSITDKSFVLTSQNKDITVDTNADTTITSLSKGVRKTLKFKDLAQDQKILVWGQYNKDIETLTAKAILSRIFSQNLVGTVKSIDDKNITVTDKSDNKDYTLTIATAKIKSLKKDKSMGTITIKDIAEGDFVHVYASGETALRILIVPKSFPTPSPKPSPTGK